MRTDCKIDNRRVIAPNASLLAGRGRIVKAGYAFTYDNGGGVGIARSLGRVTTTGADGDSVSGFVLAMVLSQGATHAFERWIDPASITAVFESPSKLAAFFFAPAIPYDAQVMRRLMAYGTICERYIDSAPATAAAMKQSPRIVGENQ